MNRTDFGTFLKRLTDQFREQIEQASVAKRPFWQHDVAERQPAGLTPDRDREKIETNETGRFPQNRLDRILPQMTLLETERLILRQFELADADALQQVFGDPEVMRYGAGVQTARWICDWLGRCLDGYGRKPEIGPWAVIERSVAATIGYCGLFEFADVCGRPETEIGYRLARAFWGRGYATEVTRAIRDYAFQTLRLPRLIAMIDPENAASIRVAEKLGMWYEQDVMLAGYTHPDRVYAVERCESE